MMCTFALPMTLKCSPNLGKTETLKFGRKQNVSNSLFALNPLEARESGNTLNFLCDIVWFMLPLIAEGRHWNFLEGHLMLSEPCSWASCLSQGTEGRVGTLVPFLLMLTSIFTSAFNKHTSKSAWTLFRPRAWQLLFEPMELRSIWLSTEVNLSLPLQPDCLIDQNSINRQL